MKTKYIFKIIVLMAFLAVFAQPAPAIDIPDDLSVGTWDDTNRIYTLTSDVAEGLVITQENLTLDGGGKKVTGTGTGSGVSLYHIRVVTVKNLTIQGFNGGINISNSYDYDWDEWRWIGGHTIENNTISSVNIGINVASSNGNTITNNNISASSYGIPISGSENNSVTGNTINSAIGEGISIGEGWQGGTWRWSKKNTLSGNTITGVSVNSGNGIFLEEADESLLINNTITNYRYGIKVRSNATNMVGTQITTNNISDNYWGIHIYASLKNTLTGNNVSNNAGGIWLEGSDDNSLESNTVTGQVAAGIYLSVQSSNNTLTGNTSSNNRDGINLNGVGNNTVTENTVSNNEYGIKVLNSNDNTISDNDISGNTWGIWIDPSNNNTFTENNISTNTQGLYMEDSSLNQVYNNNFIDNVTYQAYVTGGSGNVFNSEDPAVGGNYWSDWSGAGPYMFTGGQDNAPWADPDGWIAPPPDTTPPEITCPGDTTIEAMDPDGVPIGDDRIQTFLGGASATDNVDLPEDIVITNDAPALFPPGDTIVTFTATDTSGNVSSCQSTLTVVEAAAGYLRIIPRIVNREGRLGKVLAVIRFPEGITEADIDIGQPLVLYPGDSVDGIEAFDQRVITWYRWGSLRVSVFACFDKDDMMALIPEDGSVETMVIGRFTDGQYFYGLDTIKIISWSWCWWW
ncbi:MAG: right-handed parallel beta-helix repeat-containing protein [Sedimentisphaerales bacterium]|nr:right-handed parallel beta-helix repeat-containing protein [Sedimentisphaerales bacterium]